MKTLADLRRAMKAGTTLEFTEHIHPHLLGARVIERVTTRDWVIGFPEGHPKKAPGAGSWMSIPRSRDITFNEDGSVSIRDVDGRPFVRFHVVCGMCSPGHDSGDGTCERHGKRIVRV
jgi:hypothetical protein